MKLVALSHAFGVALVCQESIIELPCDPFSLWQNHAAWHAFNGTAVGLYYLYIRSEHIDYRSELDETLLKKIEERSKVTFPIICRVPFFVFSASRSIDELTGKVKIDL